MVVLAVPEATPKRPQSIIEAMSFYLKFIDFCIASPKMKERVVQKCALRDARHVDSAMLGPLSVYRHKVFIVASDNGVSIGPQP